MRSQARRHRQRASLFSDPQCQTATHPLVTAASPAMTTRNGIAAMRLASGSSFTLAKKACLERTGGDVFASLERGRRSAERRTTVAAPDAQAQPRPYARPLAFRRSSAVMRRDFLSQLGLGRASWNHRMQTGGPSPTPVQRAPRSPTRAGRDDAQTACKSKSDELRPQEPHPLRQSASPVTSLTMSGMAAIT